MHADLMIFETPHVFSSYSNVSLMRHDFLCTLSHWIHRFQIGKNIGFQVYIALFLGWCQCGCRNVIQAVRDRKEVSYISQEFCDNFCMLRKVCLNLPSTGQNGPPTVYIKTMVYIYK